MKGDDNWIKVTWGMGTPTSLTGGAGTCQFHWENDECKTSSSCLCGAAHEVAGCSFLLLEWRSKGGRLWMDLRC